MYLPNQSKPSVRNGRRRSGRGDDSDGILPLQAEGENSDHEVPESDESDDSVASEESSY